MTIIERTPPDRSIRNATNTAQHPTLALRLQLFDQLTGPGDREAHACQGGVAGILCWDDTIAT